jgi:transposase
VSSRYELSDVQWERIKDTLPGRLEHVGRTAADNRQFVKGVLWVLRSGARWHDLPPRYGKYKSVHARFMRWARSGIWERLFADLVKDKKNECLMLDSTIVRAHQQAAGPQKGGSADPALGRSRGGLSTKIHLLTDEEGLPLDFRITPGQAAEQPQALPLLEGRLAEAVIADRGYDTRHRRIRPRHGSRRGHPAPQPLAGQARLRQGALPETQPDRTMLQPTQTIPPIQHTILQNLRSIPRNHSNRMRLDQTQAICGYTLGV